MVIAYTFSGICSSIHDCNALSTERHECNICNRSASYSCLIGAFEVNQKTRLFSVWVLSYVRVYAKRRLQLLLINTIALKSPCFKSTHNRERTSV